jgi:hypothetical protein
MLPCLHRLRPEDVNRVLTAIQLQFYCLLLLQARAVRACGPVTYNSMWCGVSREIESINYASILRRVV